MFNSAIRGTIIGNCNGKWRLQWQPTTTTERVWRKLSPEAVVDLLINASSRPQYSPDGVSTSYLAGQLLRSMLDESWAILATAHQGGKHGSTSADENLHITVRIASNKAHHLTCKEEPTLHIIGISDRPPD